MAKAMSSFQGVPPPPLLLPANAHVGTDDVGYWFTGKNEIITMNLIAYTKRCGNPGNVKK